MTPNRTDIVAAAFAAGGPGTAFDPLRAQKLLFLIDRVVADRIGGPFFNFEPYHYGPFDRTIHGELTRMEARGDLLVDRSGHYPRYALTDEGRAKGEAVLARFTPPIADYFGRAARWVLLVPYRHMLAALYREYPDMAVNSVFRDLKPKPPPPRRNPLVEGVASAFDLMGTLDPPEDSETDSETDAEAIEAVWREVGECLEGAMVRFGESERLW